MEASPNVSPRDSSRRVTEVAEPPWEPLTQEELYGIDSENKKPNLKAVFIFVIFFFSHFHQLHRHLNAGGKLSLEHAYEIIKGATDIMTEEENCLDLWSPFVVVGDIHGQYQV
jgi:hypothetical protein